MASGKPRPRIRTVFVVTVGEYSDYRIEAVYLDRALAEQHVANTDYTLEEYEVAEQAPTWVEVLHMTIGQHSWSSVDPEYVLLKHEEDEVVARFIAAKEANSADVEQISEELRAKRQKRRQYGGNKQIQQMQYVEGEDMRLEDGEDAPVVSSIGSGNPDRVWDTPVHVFGTDHKRVRKTYSEKRAQFLYEHPEIHPEPYAKR